MNTTASRAQVAFNYALLTLCSIVAIYPLIGVALASLYPPGPDSAPSGFGLPPTFAWHNYVTAWEQGKFASSFQTRFVNPLKYGSTFASSVNSAFGIVNPRTSGS